MAHLLHALCIGLALPPSPHHSPQYDHVERSAASSFLLHAHSREHARAHIPLKAATCELTEPLRVPKAGRGWELQVRCARSVMGEDHGGWCLRPEEPCEHWPSLGEVFGCIRVAANK